MDSYASVWPFELVSMSTLLQHGHLSGGDGIPHSSLDPFVRVKNSYALVWRVQLWSGTPMLQISHLSWVAEPSQFFVPCPVGVKVLVGVKESGTWVARLVWVKHSDFSICPLN